MSNPRSVPTWIPVFEAPTFRSDFESRLMLARLTLLFMMCGLVSMTRGQEAADPDPEALKNEFKRAEFQPQARVAAQQGVDFLAAKDFKKAINAFASAVRMHPNNAQLRHLLGAAYYRDRQLGPAWLQLRKAVFLNPTYAPAVKDFESVWVAFERQNVFAMGRPQEQLAKLIGEPDAKANDERQEIWSYGFMRLQFVDGRLSAVIDPRGVREADRYPLDALKVEFDDPSRWVLGNRFINRMHSLSEYVPAGQSVRDWTEMLQLQRLLHQALDSSPLELAKQIEDQLKSGVPQVNFRLISQTPDEVLYQWNTPGSKDHPEQHEIVRLVRGQRDIHRLAYTRRSQQISQADAQKWLNLLRKAELQTAAVQSSPAVSE